MALYLDLQAERVGLPSGWYHICLSSVSCLFICCTALYLYLLVEGVGLLSVASIKYVCGLFLLVSLSVGWLSTCVSWLKESVC
jgi:hypothetical protein